MHSAARDLPTETLRRRKDRAASLLNALRYERAVTYEALGQAKRARADLEAIFADDPDSVLSESSLVNPMTVRRWRGNVAPHSSSAGLLIAWTAES
jgi:predicted Zn-dependent protease